MTDIDQVLADIEAGRQQRIAAGDWAKLPAGYYALPVHCWNEGDLLGYLLFSRTAARTARNGRTYGKDGFRAGATYTVDGMGDRLREQIDTDKRLSGGWEPWSREQVAELLDDPDSYRAVYGQITGHCGFCHRPLFDPESKLRGIGPECWRNARVVEVTR